jgi:hypothetical protein
MEEKKAALKAAQDALVAAKAATPNDAAAIAAAQAKVDEAQEAVNEV